MPHSDNRGEWIEGVELDGMKSNFVFLCLCENRVKEIRNK